MENKKENNQNKQENNIVKELIQAYREEYQLTAIQKIAQENFKVYNAHVSAGFTPQQAMQILLLYIDLNRNSWKGVL